MNLHQRLRTNLASRDSWFFTLFFLAFAALAVGMALLPGALPLKIAVATWMIL